MSDVFAHGFTGVRRSMHSRTVTVRVTTRSMISLSSSVISVYPSCSLRVSFVEQLNY